MADRYPDLNEPVRTPAGSFQVVSLHAGEFVECPVCFAILRKTAAKRHAETSHLTVRGRT